MAQEVTRGGGGVTRGGGGPRMMANGDIMDDATRDGSAGDVVVTMVKDESTRDRAPSVYDAQAREHACNLLASPSLHLPPCISLLASPSSHLPPWISALTSHRLTPSVYDAQPTATYGVVVPTNQPVPRGRPRWLRDKAPWEKAPAISAATSNGLPAGEASEEEEPNLMQKVWGSAPLPRRHLASSSSPPPQCHVSCCHCHVLPLHILASRYLLPLQVKDAGVAGLVSYMFWELAFWGVSIPVCILGAHAISLYLPVSPSHLHPRLHPR